MSACVKAGLGSLPGESLTQRTVPVDLEERIGAGNAPDSLSEGAHDLQRPLALNPSQGGHDRDRPVRPSLLGTGALQAPGLNGDAVGQHGDRVVSAGTMNVGSEHGGHGREPRSSGGGDAGPGEG